MCDLLLKDYRGFHKSPPVHPPYAEAEYVQKPLVKSDTCISCQSFFLNIKPPFPFLSHLPQIDLIHSFHSVFSSCLTQQQFRAYNLTALAGKPQDQTLHWRNIPHLWHVFWKKLSIRSLLWVVCFCARMHVCAEGCVQAVRVSLITLGDFYFNKIWVTLPQSASSVAKMCSPVVGGNAFSSSLFPLWVFIWSSANSITGGWLTPQCPFLHRCTRHTHTHTSKRMHHGAWLEEVYEVSAVSASQRTCEMISYSPASLPTQTLPFSVFYQPMHRHALSFTIFLSVFPIWGVFLIPTQHFPLSWIYSRDEMWSRANVIEYDK